MRVCAMAEFPVIVMLGFAILGVILVNGLFSFWQEYRAEKAADELRKRNCGTINLIVSHGIFSKGIDALTNIDRIYSTDSFKDLEHNNKLTQIKLCNILI